MRGLQSYITALLKQFRSKFQQNRSGLPLAELAWWAFLFSLVTGVILSFNYRPWGDVFKSVSKLTGWLPYGAFFRRFHYLSGQAFLILTFAHTLEHFLRETYRHIKPQEWTKLVLLFFLSFPLVFTGFILKGDKGGIIAGRVMYNLAQEIPYLGSGLAALLLRPGEEFFFLPYLHHTVILPLVVIFLLGRHRKHLLPKGGLGWTLMAFLAFLATFYSLPPDVPPHVETTQIAGPWFFHGIQLLLRYGPPFWVGVIWPLVPIGLLAILSFIPSSLLKWAKWIVIITWLFHVTFLLIAWCLVPGSIK